MASTAATGAAPLSWLLWLLWLATAAAFRPCGDLSGASASRCEFVAPHDGFFSAPHRGLAHVPRKHAPVAPDKSRAVLRVVTPTPIRHLDSVVLAFDIPDDAGNDWIGIYCVEDERAPNADHDFLDAHPLQGATRGEVEIRRLLNMRCSWHFRLFRTSARDEHRHFRLAHTPFVRMARGPDHPFQIHLALTADAAQMRVMWVSGVANAHSTSNSSATQQRVVFGERPDALDRVADARRQVYAASDMCEAPATTVHASLFRDPGQLWDAVLEGLEPGRQYFYRIETQTPSGAVSKTFSFRAPVPAGHAPAPGRAHSFFVYGDMGDDVMPPVGSLPSDRAGTTADLMLIDSHFEPQFDWLAVVHIGDISYAKGRTYIWDQFGAIIEPVAAELPYMVGVGNHDYCYYSGAEHDPSRPAGGAPFHPPDAPTDCQSGGECGVPLSRRYIMPATGNGVFWYSFDTGLVHHVVLSSEHDFLPGSRMYNWLVSDLRRVDRGLTPWVFLYIHRPMYCSEQYELDYKLSRLLRQHLETLCGIYGVDVVFSGHYHAYERTCPVFQEQCLAEPLPGADVNGGPLEKALAPVHIMAGSAGAYVDDAGYYDVAWSRRALKQYGYGRVHVFNATHVRYEFKGNHERAVVDAAWIISDHTWHQDLFERTAAAKRRTRAPTPAPTPEPTPEPMTPAPTPREEDAMPLYIETDDDLRHVMREKNELPLLQQQRLRSPAPSRMPPPQVPPVDEIAPLAEPFDTEAPFPL
ncbi:hypothetical protein PINS_up015353 [Pythium insidiosum]|nr:hypothetical protein PINS_up015353 [Pythium insidiosum]